MEENLKYEVERAEKYRRLNFWLRVIFGVYFILYIPHMFLVMGYMFACCLITFLNLLLGFLTGKLHPGLTVFTTNGLRFMMRLNNSMVGLVEKIPHVDINAKAPDFPVRLELAVDEDVSKGFCLIRLLGIVWFLLIPHLFVLFFYGIATNFLGSIGFIVVLFAGKWPVGLHRFAVNYQRYALRTMTYAMGLRKRYPPFSGAVQSS